jgi:iron-sulfur cluster assembly protein
MHTTTQAEPTATPASVQDRAEKQAADHPLHLTDAAVAQVKEVCKAQGFEGYYLSVRVVPSGCSGFGYDLNLIKDARPGDLTWEQDGIKIATDGLSSKYLAGTEVDYLSTLQGAGFKFHNPQAKSSCGCGSSFST